MIRTRFAKLGYVDTRLDVDTNNIEMTVTALGSAFLSMTVDETKEFINVLYRLVKDADEDNERMKRYIDRFNRRTAELNEGLPRKLEPINRLHPDDATVAAQAPRASPRWPVNEIPLPLRPAGIGKTEAIDNRLVAPVVDVAALEKWVDENDPQHPSNRGFDGPTGAE